MTTFRLVIAALIVLQCNAIALPLSFKETEYFGVYSTNSKDSRVNHKALATKDDGTLWIHSNSITNYVASITEDGAIQQFKTGNYLSINSADNMLISSAVPFSGFSIFRNDKLLALDGQIDATVCPKNNEFQL
jgi:hypothetical protein